jgi:hypothetical protein
LAVGKDGRGVKSKVNRNVVDVDRDSPCSIGRIGYVGFVGVSIAEAEEGKKKKRGEKQSAKRIERSGMKRSRGQRRRLSAKSDRD